MSLKIQDLEKELDEAMRRADAYREVARFYGNVCRRKNCRCGPDMDAMALKIMQKKRKQKCEG